MKKIIIKGGKKLNGIITISGAKNAATPIMAASILANEGETKLFNIPKVDDILILKRILNKLGIYVHFSDGFMLIDANNMNSYTLPLKESQMTRASIITAGPLLAKFGKVIITEPGGCVIGKRPIDFHLDGFKALGADIKEVNKQYLKIEASKLEGNKINFPFPSVSATENIMMAACYAEGETIIENAAKEPEVVDLANYLQSMGANIKGAGTSIVKIEGVKDLIATKYTIISDRIETGTYIIAAAITNGDVLLKNTEITFLEKVISKLREIGVVIEKNDEGVRVSSSNHLQPIDVITEVYPGFPTDLQPVVTSLLSITNGKSKIRETVFEKRFNHVPELIKMGADIEVYGDTIIINGVKKLKGAKLKALDIRSGGSLFIAGLIAEGKTIITGVQQIFRGYEKPLEKLKNVGADIYFTNNRIS